MTGYTTLTLSDVPPAQMRTANALAGTGQQLFTGLAVALASVALRAGDALGSHVPRGESPRFPYVVAFLVVSVVAAAATVVALRLHPSAGDDPHRRRVGRRLSSRDIGLVGAAGYGATVRALPACSSPQLTIRSG